MSAMLDYMQLCRLCLVKEKVNVPIFGDENDVRQIFLKITACLPVKVAQEDNLPKKICDSCLYKVDLLYQFWNTTVNAEKQLIQWLTEIGVDVNIKNAETQPLPMLPQSHAHPHSMPESIMLKEEHTDLVDQQQAGFTMPGQQAIYPSYDNLGYPQAEVTMEVGTPAFVQQTTSVPKVEPEAVPETQAPAPKKRGRPAGSAKKSQPPPKKKAVVAPTPTVAPRTNPNRRSSATAAAAAVAAAAAATDSDEDSDGDRLGGLDDDSDSDDDHIAKEEADSDEEYVEPTAFVGVPSTSAQDGEQPGPSGLSGANSKAGAPGATESGLAAPTIETQGGQVSVIHWRSKTKKSWPCSACGKLFSTKLQASIHYKYQHLGYSIHLCTVCDEKFRTPKELDRHVRTHYGDYTYRCEECNKGYQVKNQYEHHVQTKHQGVRFICFPCNRIYKNRYYYIDHMNWHDPNYVKKFYCKKCNEPMRDRNHYVLHMRKHRDNKCVCDVCGKTLNSKASLRDHRRTHTGERPFSCPVCNIRFVTKRGLQKHQKLHLPDRPFKCDFCDKAFTEATQLNIHRRNHTGDRPFACHICQKTFTTMWAVRAHAKIHGTAAAKIHKDINKILLANK